MTTYLESPDFSVMVLTPSYPNPGNPTEGLFNQHHALALRAKGERVEVGVAKPWAPGSLARFIPGREALANLPRSEVREGLNVRFVRYMHIPSYRFPAITIRSCERSLDRWRQERCPESTPSILQIHSAWPVGMAAPLLTKRWDLPFVVTLHIEEEERLIQDEKVQCLYALMLERASAIIAVGSPLKRFALSLARSDLGRKLRIIPNGIEPLEFDGVEPKDDDRPSTGGTVIAVGNLWPTKGHDTTLRALAHLEKENVPWRRFVVVGEGPERNRLAALARQLGIEEKVYFTGRLPHDQALRQVSEADIFCLPSWREAFGVVYLEAMYLGKPVIACAGQGAEDIVSQEKDGLLVPPKDPHSLAKALRRLLENPMEATRMGESGRLRASGFTWERVASQYLGLYREILSQPHAGVVSHGLEANSLTKRQGK